MPYPVAAARGRNFGAAAIPRWLTGGIAAADCLAAYEPLGAASLADSYINLAHPGTNDATPVVAPTLDASGWVLNAAAHLTTGINPNGANYSAIVRYSDVTAGNTGHLINATGATQFYLWPYAAGDMYAANGSWTYVTYAAAGGVAAIAGPNLYINGIKVGPDLSNLGVDLALSIGARYNGSTYDQFLTGKIQRLYIYRVDISAQIVALTAAINS